MRLETSKSSADQNKFCIFWFLFSLNIHVKKKLNPFQSKLERGLSTYTLWLNFYPTHKICALPVKEAKTTDRLHAKKMTTIYI